MKTAKIFVGMIVGMILGGLLPLSASEEGLKTVHLVVDHRDTKPWILEPQGYRECDVTLPKGANAGDVLDKATTEGCISGWSYTTDPQYGRFVTEIDGASGHCDFPTYFVVCSYWAIYFNGNFSDVGIDGLVPPDNSTLSFVYTTIYALGLVSLP